MMKKIVLIICFFLFLLPVTWWHLELIFNYEWKVSLLDKCCHRDGNYSAKPLRCQVFGPHELDVILLFHPFAEGYYARFFLNVFELDKDYKKHPELLKDLDMAVKLDPWNPYNRFNQAFYSTNCNLKQLNYIKFKDEEYVCTTSYHVFGRLECVNQKDIEQLRKDTCECTSDKEFLENYCTEENI